MRVRAKTLVLIGLLAACPVPTALARGRGGRATAVANSSGAVAAVTPQLEAASGDVPGRLGRLARAMLGFGMVAFGTVAGGLALDSILRRHGRAVSRQSGGCRGDGYLHQPTLPQQVTLLLQPIAGMSPRITASPDATLRMDARALGALEETLRVPSLASSDIPESVMLPPPPPLLDLRLPPSAEPAPPPVEAASVAEPPVVKAGPPPVPPADANAPLAMLPIYRRLLKGAAVNGEKTAEKASELEGGATPPAPESSGSLAASDSGVIMRAEDALEEPLFYHLSGDRARRF